MANYYPSGCDILPAHTVDNCDNNEMGRVRGIALVHKDYAFTLVTDPAEWATAIANGDIIVIPETNGTYDGGKVKTGPGYGDTVDTFTGIDFSAKVKDPNLKSNTAFANAAVGTRNYRLAFRTETQLFLADKPCSISPSNPVADGLDSQVVWDYEFKWVSRVYPALSVIPVGVFAS